MRPFKGQSEKFRLLAIVCAVLIPVGAHPQDAQVAEPASKPMEEVIVTGSLIPQANMISSSPITEISTQEILLEGVTDTSTLLNALPQVFQNSLTDFSSTSNPLATPGGLSTVNLRGLGPQRTLVLINGRRLGVGDANTGNPNPAPDINQIPTQLIERVDVVTGGASAIYGSDAVAGVVNFIMKKDFEGIEVDYQAGFARHENDSSLFKGLLDEAGYDRPSGTTTDGDNYALSLLMGTGINDGRGNITAFFSYRKQDPILQGDRDFGSCELNVDDGTTPYCTGSPNSNDFNTVYDLSRDLQVAGNEFVPWGSADTNPPAIFNTNPLMQLSRPDTRYTAGVFANQEINEKVNGYFEFSYMDDKSSASIAPSAAFLGGNPYNATGGNLINCDNPLMSAQQVEAIGCNDPALVDANGNVDVYVGRRNVEGGGRVSSYEHENFRYTIGADGDLGQGWNYDTYFQYYYSTLFQSDENYLSNSRINNALQVVDVNGVPTCKSVVDGTDPACVPWNIFLEGGVTPDQVGYLNSLGTSYGTVAEKIVSGQVTNDLGRYGIQLPWAKDGVGIAIGAQYRWDSMDFQPDAVSTANDLSGFGGAGTAVDDSIHVMEEYIELRVPIVQGRKWIEELIFETAYRSSDYNLAGRVGTFKFGLQWQPNEDVRFRTSYNRAVRAPNIIDLFTPQSVTNTSVIDTDPCAGSLDDPATATLEECMRTGVTALQYGDGAGTSQIVQCPAGQCSVLQGGNSDLDPETADTFTIGLTFTPAYIENFTASIDYYEIKVDDIIGSVPVDITLQNCLAGDLAYCGSVVRTSTGNLFGTTITGGGYVAGTSLNVSRQTVSGVDVQLNYSWTMPNNWGDLSTALDGSWIDKNTTTNLPGSPEYDCAGLYGATCQTLNPDWRSTLRLSWTTPWDLLLSAQWRYIDGVSLDTNSSQSQLNNGEYNSFSARLPSVSYFDLSAIWNAPYGFDVRAGIDNIFDKSPPAVDSSVAGTGSPNTFPTYDLLGQVFFVGFTKKL